MKTKKKIQYHKRHFQLLEILVAVLILLICVVPMMNIFTSMYMTQIETIRENRRDHLAHLVHAKFTEELYHRKVDIDGEIEGRQVSLSDKDLVDELTASGFSCSGFFSIKTSSDNQGKPKQHLCQLEIKMKDMVSEAKKKKTFAQTSENDPNEIVYDYQIFIDRTTESNEKKNDSKDKANIDPKSKESTETSTSNSSSSSDENKRD